MLLFSLGAVLEEAEVAPDILEPACARFPLATIALVPFLELFRRFELEPEVPVEGSLGDFECNERFLLVARSFDDARPVARAALCPPLPTGPLRG